MDWVGWVGIRAYGREKIKWSVILRAPLAKGEAGPGGIE